MYKTRILLLLFSFAVIRAQAQETDYSDVNVSIQQPPTLTRYTAYKTFDLTVLTTRTEQDKPGTGFNLPYAVKAGTLSQVQDGGEFHIISLLQRYGGKMTSQSTADINVVLTSTVYDKFGNVVKTGTVNNEHYPVNFGRALSKEESGNADVLRRLTMEKLIEASLQPLVDGIFGSVQSPVVRIASLDDVKKKPELQEFDAQLKVLKPALEKGSLEGFKTAAAPYLTYWERMSAYAGDDAEEVKRAALHNLALYAIAGADYDKARTYLEQYKPIDKQIKQMFGLIKYKNSEKLEELIALLNPAVADAAPASVNATEMSRDKIVENYRFLTINGTAKISGKRDEGTYQGLIRVHKIQSGNFGSIASLDPENIVVTIQTKDAAGQPKTINTTVSKIDELKDDNGTSYTVQKFGTPMLGEGTYYIFLQSSYSSPKITVYRAVIPASGEYVVKKAGDEKGVKSSLFNARKNLEEYLSDCAPLAEKFKNGTIDKKVSAEKIAEMYTNCN